MYFRYFDTFSYTLNSKEFDFTNLFKRVSFSSKTLNNSKIFSNYYLVEGDTLESISKQFYNDESLSWIILLSNNFISKYEFPQSLDKIENQARTKYPGSSFYFYEYMPEIKPGDILIKCTVSGEEIINYDTSKYAIVQEYNSIFRYAIVRENYGIEEDSYVSIKRLNENNSVENVNIDVIVEENGPILSRNFARLKLITDAINSPIEFLNGNNNYISPYYINDVYESASNTLGIYNTATVSDTKTIYNTLLYSYISQTSIPSLRTIFQQYIEDNNKNRIIKILKPKYINFVFEAVQDLLTSDEIRTVTINIEE